MVYFLNFCKVVAFCSITANVFGLAMVAKRKTPNLLILFYYKCKQYTLIIQLFCHYCQTDVGCSWFFRRFVTQKCVNVEVEFNRIFFHFLKNFLISISFFQTVNIYYRFRVVKNRIFVSEIAFVFILSFVSILMQTQLLQHVAEI